MFKSSWVLKTKTMFTLDNINNLFIYIYKLFGLLQVSLCFLYESLSAYFLQSHTCILSEQSVLDLYSEYADCHLVFGDISNF